MSKSRNFFGQPCKETHSEAVVSRFSSADSQRPASGGRVTIGRWSLDHRSVAAGNFVKKNGNHRRKNDKSRRSSIPLPGICRPMLVRKGSQYSQKISVPQVDQGRMTPRKNQANTQVTFIKSLADRITFQAYLEFLQTAITENVPYACDGVRHIFFMDIFRISCDSDSC